MFNTPAWQRYSGNFVTGGRACLRRGQQALVDVAGSAGSRLFSHASREK
jgi:hypothetical protein